MIHLQEITNAGKDVDGELWQCEECGVARPIPNVCIPDKAKVLEDWVCDCTKVKKIIKIQYKIIEGRVVIL